MTQRYDRHGVQFDYPADWEVTEQGSELELAVTVSSPQTAYWTVTLLRDLPDPEDVLETVVQTFREEYPDLDVENAIEQIGRHLTAGCNIDFFCLELLNVASARTFQVADCTVLVLTQAYEGELKEIGPHFQRLNASLRVQPEAPRPSNMISLA